MWCTRGSTRTMTWISDCRGLTTLPQPLHPLCYQGSSAVFVSLGGQRYPESLPLPRWKGACGVPAELPLGQSVPGPSHISVSVEIEGNKLYEQGGVDLDQTLPAADPEKLAAVIISDNDDIDFPVNAPQAISTPKIELAWSQK